MPPRDVKDLVERLLAGDRIAAARLITLAENRAPEAREAIRRLYPHTGRAHVIGITGAPGAGKSTLVDKLVDHYRGQGLKVGVVAVDPTSPFTGGAILGDRVRMQSRSTDRDVFIRSLGSRGALGGLSRAAHDAVRVLDALGKDVILVETVGVGQAEVDIVRLADTVSVITVPGLGDDIQNIKAGIMEIADVFVVNKADRDGADKTVAELQAWLEFKMEHGDAWQVPVQRTVAEKGDGIPELTETYARHIQHLRAHDLDARRRAQAEHEMVDILKATVTRYVFNEDTAHEAFRALAEKVARRELDPYTAAESVFEEVRREQAAPDEVG